MTLKNKYRTVLCKQYDQLRQIKKQWWEVQCYKRMWWTFGFYKWVSEKHSLTYFDYTIKFSSEESALEFIKRIHDNIPQSTITYTPMTTFI